MVSRVWITWEYQPRNRSMAKCIGADVFEIIVDVNRVLRYIICSWKTFLIIYREKPKEVFVQNPSIVLALLALTLRPICNYRLIIDQHNSGILPVEGKIKVLNMVSEIIIRNSDLNIVTNNQLKEYVEKKMGRAVVVPDPLPELLAKVRNRESRISNETFNILFVCSWGKDEPYEEVIKSLQYLTHRPVVMYASGNYSKSLSTNAAEKIPKNFILTGYMSYSDYCQLMSDVDAVVVLTKRSNCLNCGVYEALSLGKPGVITDDMETARYFNKGYVKTKISALEISKSIELLIEDYEILCKEANLLKDEVALSYGRFISNLESSIDELDL